MKTLFALSVLGLGLSSQAASIPNGVARVQLQKLLFGNESTQTEHLSIPGQQSMGESCTIELRKTRYGVYVAVATPNAPGGMESGITNSHYTTQNLDFTMDESSVKFSRMGITGINERGEDYGNETATLEFEKVGDLTKVKSLSVSYEAVKVDQDAKYNPIYTPSGQIFSKDCTAL